MGGLRPVVAIYSTFLTRAFDQCIFDVGLHGLPVVFCRRPGRGHRSRRRLGTGHARPGPALQDAGHDRVRAVVVPGAPADAPRRPRHHRRARSRSAGPSTPRADGRRRRGRQRPLGPPRRRGRPTRRSASSVWARCSTPLCEAAERAARRGHRLHRLGPPRRASPSTRTWWPTPPATPSWSPSRTDSAKAARAHDWPSSSADAAAESGAAHPPFVRALGTPREYIAQGKPDEILAGFGLDAAGIAAAARRTLR